MSPHTPDIAFGQPLETQIDVPRARNQPLEAEIPGISLPAEAMRHGKTGYRQKTPEGATYKRNMVGDTRFELVTPSVSGKCATSAPTARVMRRTRICQAQQEVGTRVELVYTALQAAA